MTPLLRRAFAYAADGLPVFPLFEPTGDGTCSCGESGCRSGHPRTRHGLHDATTDPATIEAWWRHWPTANIGVRTGTAGGIVAVDVDSIAAGLALLELVDYRPLGGLFVRTGRGWHLWYRTPAEIIRNSASQLALDLDARGEGGYVVAPPSLHRSGRRYRFDGGRLTLPPGWLVELLAEPADQHEPEQEYHVDATDDDELDRMLARPYGAAVLRGRCDAVRAAAEGGRNYALLRAATTVGGYIASGAIDEDRARNELTAAAVDVGLGAKETARTIASGFKRGMAQPLHVPNLEGAA
jgi:hypothetical protein